MYTGKSSDFAAYRTQSLPKPKNRIKLFQCARTVSPRPDLIAYRVVPARLVRPVRRLEDEAVGLVAQGGLGELGAKEDVGLVQRPELLQPYAEGLARLVYPAL